MLLVHVLTYKPAGSSIIFLSQVQPRWIRVLVFCFKYPGEPSELTVSVTHLLKISFLYGIVFDSNSHLLTLPNAKGICSVLEKLESPVSSVVKSIFTEKLKQARGKHHT